MSTLPALGWSSAEVIKWYNAVLQLFAESHS